MLSFLNWLAGANTNPNAPGASGAAGGNGSAGGALQAIFSRKSKHIPARRLTVPHPRPTAALDPFLGESLLPQLRAQLKQGDYSGAIAALEQVNDPDDRNFLVESISDWEGRPDWLDNWVAAHPRLPAANLIAGAHAVYWGWQARSGGGGGVADTREPEAIEAMNKRLQLADSLLRRAAELEPMDPTPWVFLTRSARGQDLDECETRQRFEHVTRLAPHHRAAHSHMLQKLSAKWGGTHESMFSFAQHISRTAPPGTGVHVMIAEAHFERWLADSKGLVRTPDPYFQQPRVRESLKVAARLAFESGSGDNVNSGGGAVNDEFHSTIDSIRNRNFFAFCFFVAGDREEAAKQFRAIGGWATPLPWLVMGSDPLKNFSRAAAASGIMLAKAA